MDDTSHRMKATENVTASQTLPNHPNDVQFRPFRVAEDQHTSMERGSHLNITAFASGFLRFLQLDRSLDAESVLENISDVLKCHALDFRITEIDTREDAEKADGRVESKSAGWSGVFHLCQESASHNHL